MNLPNKLTLFRLILSLLFIISLEQHIVASYKSTAFDIAILLFCIACATDFLDGYLARKFNQVTNFGKLFDPLADKILVCSAFILLGCLQLIPGWIVALLLAREFLVTGLRSLAASNGVVLPADQVGKIKTTAHMLTIIATLVVARIFSLTDSSPNTTLPGPMWGYWLAWTSCLSLSWFSGFQYLWACRKLLQAK